MRMSRSELNLLKDLSNMLEAPIYCRLYGDIIFNQGKILAKSDNSYFEICIEGDTVTVKDDILKEYLVNRICMTSTNISEFDWADQIYLNYCEVQIKSKLYTDRRTLFTDYFTIALHYYKASALTVIYRSKNKLYSALYFKHNRKFYSEYIVPDKKTKSLKVLLINQQNYEMLETKVKDLSFLAVAPNYETPSLKSYLIQLNSLAEKSKFRFEF